MDKSEALEKARQAPRKKRPSMRKAIDAFCKGCIYDGSSGSGTWRQQVEACTATQCPLFELRPISGGSTGKNEVQRMIPLPRKSRPAIIVDDRLDDIEYERVEVPEVVKAISGERITDEDYRPVPGVEGGDDD